MASILRHVYEDEFLEERKHGAIEDVQVKIEDNKNATIYGLGIEGGCVGRLLDLLNKKAKIPGKVKDIKILDVFVYNSTVTRLRR